MAAPVSPDGLPQPKGRYSDGRPAARWRMPAQDAGVVLRHGTRPGCFDEHGARDVVVFADGGRFFMHYDAAGPQGWLAALAVSDDGIHWHKQGPILSLGEPGSWDSGSASYGVPYRLRDDEWHLFYLGTPNTSPPPERIPAFPYLTGQAIATDPQGPWVKRPGLRPLDPPPGSWYEHTASPGQIVHHEGRFLHFFSAARTSSPGRIERTLGLAHAQSLAGPWVVQPEPILPISEQIENSSLYREPTTGTWFLFTNHVAINDDPSVLLPPENTAEFTDAIWVYWSTDLWHWNPAHKAVVLDTLTCPWSTGVIGLPSVLPIGDRLAVYYDGRADGTLGHAYRDIGLCWLDLPLTPPTAGPTPR